MKALRLSFLLIISCFWVNSVQAQLVDSLITEGRRLVNEELKFEQARVLFSQAADLAEANNDFVNLAKANYRIGRAFYYQDNFVLALRYFLVTEDAINRNGEFVAEAPVFIAIGVIYDALENHDQAIVYHDKALAQAKAEGNDFYRAIILNNKAESYYLVNDLTNALDQGKRSYQLYDSLAHEMGKSEVLPKLGAIELAQDNLGNAKSHIDEAFEIIIGAKDHPRYGMAYMGLAAYFTAIKNYDKAYENLLQAKYFTDSLEQLNTQFEVHQLLAKNSEDRGDFKKALDYTKMAKVLSDTLQKIQDRIITNETLTQFDTQQKEAQIENLNAQNSRNAEQLKNQQTFIVLASIGLVAVLIISFLIFTLYKKSKKSRTSLEEKNQQITTLVQELHHRVKNNLQVVSGILELQSNKSENAEVKNSLMEGQHRVKAMALIHQKLYQNEKLNKVDLNEYLRELASSIHMLCILPGQKVGINYKIESIALDVDVAVSLGLIANELITNAFKHGFAEGRDGQITISTNSLADDRYELIIEDDGIGMDTNIAENEDSLGLRLVNGLVWQIDGAFRHELNGNSKFIIEFGTHIKNGGK